MSYDVLIKNGTVVDGTGAPRHAADVAVKDGRIAEIGKVSGSARKVIDAPDLIVAPGFVDPHTHYDAQICWDPQVSCSSWHGITSVVMGNCGVGLAPCKPQVHEIAALDLVNVEGIPSRVLQNGNHLGLGELPQLHGRGGQARQLAQSGLPRAADPVSPLRDGRGLDGARGDARGNHKITALLSEAVAAGALGFSTPPAASTSATRAVRWLAAWPAATS